MRPYELYNGMATFIHLSDLTELELDVVLSY